MTTTSEERTGSPAVPGSRAAVLLALAVLLSLAGSMGTAAAVPASGGAIVAPPSSAWETAVQPLATAAALPVLGALGDRHGRRCVLLASIAVFLLGALLGATSGAAGPPPAARFLQGLGAGGMLAPVVAVTAERLPARERGHHLALLVGAMALVMAGGPPAGAVMGEQLGPLRALPPVLALGTVALALAAAPSLSPSRSAGSSLSPSSSAASSLPSSASPAPSSSAARPLPSLPSAPSGPPAQARVPVCRAAYRRVAWPLAAVTVLVRTATWGGGPRPAGRDDLLSGVVAAVRVLTRLVT
ncbi:MFS transporter [Streptomyces rochei]|uniref:MFS transporter n=1 Tax=Streptomyces rochei TaxID=1928 RepID=UPI00368E0D77